MRLIVNTTLILVAVFALGASALSADITLNDTAEAKYQYVKLGDLAGVSGVSEEEAAKINGIFCGSAPGPGEVREITVDYIKMRLRQSGFDPKSFKFAGAEAVRLKTVLIMDLPVSAEVAGDEETQDVEPAGKPAPAPSAATFEEKMKAAILSNVAQKLAVKAEDVVVVIRSVGKALEDCDTSAEIVGLRPTREIKGPGDMSFSVTAKSGDGEIRAIVNAEVTLNTDVVVAVQDISAGKALSGMMLAVRRMSISANSADYFTSPSSLEGFKATKNIAAGQPVTAAVIEQPLLVKRNDVVKVFVRVVGTDVVIETTARAEKDGRKGEFINVTNVNSKETFSAQVIGQGQVQVIVGE